MQTFDQWYDVKFPNGTTDAYKAELRAAWEAALKAFAAYILRPFQNPNTEATR